MNIIEVFIQVYTFINTFYKRFANYTIVWRLLLRVRRKFCNKIDTVPANGRPSR
jgi:hypothetical protein